MGPQAGGTAFTLQTLPVTEPNEYFTDTLVKVGGFSLNAGASNKAHERDKL